MLVSSIRLWLILIPLWIIFKIISLRFKKAKGFKVSFIYELFNTLFFVYILMLASVTLFPIRINMPDENIIIYNFVPFKSILNIYRQGIGMTLRNILGNVIMMVPFGFLIPFNSKKFNNMKRVLLSGITLSVIIELIQLTGIPNRRSVDIDDVILNVIGTMIGFISYKTIYILVDSFKSRILDIRQNSK